MAHNGSDASCLALRRCHRAVLYQRLCAGSATPASMMLPLEPISGIGITDPSGFHL